MSSAHSKAMSRFWKGYWKKQRAKWRYNYEKAWRKANEGKLDMATIDMLEEKRLILKKHAVSLRKKLQETENLKIGDVV